MLISRVVWILNILTSILGYDDLSAFRNAVQYKTSEPCLSCAATNALDRNISTCMRTMIGITSPDQDTWWYVDLGDIHSVYNIRIQFKDYGPTDLWRQQGRFAGFSLYVSNTTNLNGGYLCYKDGPKLPPLDFNTSCLTNGRYVIFYNKRTNTTYPMGYQTRNVYTELCEVTVTGCSSSDVYGENCDKPCPDNCQERRCDIINGTCFGCTTGWVGVHCDKVCPARYYGLQCESKCVGHCKCNHTSGLCDNGCDDGWTGTNCDKECTSGTYGPDCVFNCSGNCLGDVTCNRKTGKCDTSCDSGYTGEFCEKGCEIGTFGKDCSNQCSGHCLNNVPCNSTTGHCDSGCASGYVERFCNKTYLEPNALSDDCNEPSYIVGLSSLFIIGIVLGIVCLFLIRKYYRLKKEMNSLQYTSITRTSTQPDNNANGCQQYEELGLSEYRYHNMELRN